MKYLIGFILVDLFTVACLIPVYPEHLGHILFLGFGTIVAVVFFIFLHAIMKDAPPML